MIGQAVFPPVLGTLPQFPNPFHLRQHLQHQKRVPPDEQQIVPQIMEMGGSAFGWFEIVDRRG